MEFKPKRFTAADIEIRVAWINDTRINYNMFFDLPANIKDTQKWFNNNCGSTKRIDFSFINQENKVIAMGGFTDINSIHKNAEFYVMVHPDLQGKGIGKQVSIWMYNYAFSILKLNKIFLYTNNNNIAAYKIYEKAGFQLEGLLKKHKWKNNEFQDRRLYGLLHSEWEKLEWRKQIHDEI